MGATADRSKGGKSVKKQVYYCQVDGCSSKLSNCKAYCVRYRVCHQHLAAASVPLQGVGHRFCQQCGRFQELSEFDGSKRSCRARLAHHNNIRQQRRKEAATAQLLANNVLDLPRNSRPSAARTPGTFGPLLNSPDHMPEYEEPASRPSSSSGGGRSAAAHAQMTGAKQQQHTASRGQALPEGAAGARGSAQHAGRAGNSAKFGSSRWTEATAAEFFTSKASRHPWGGSAAQEQPQQQPQQQRFGGGQPSHQQQQHQLAWAPPAPSAAMAVQHMPSAGGVSMGLPLLQPAAGMPPLPLSHGSLRQPSGLLQDSARGLGLLNLVAPGASQHMPRYSQQHQHQRPQQLDAAPATTSYMQPHLLQARLDAAPGPQHTPAVVMPDAYGMPTFTGCKVTGLLPALQSLPSGDVAQPTVSTPHSRAVTGFAQHDSSSPSSGSGSGSGGVPVQSQHPQHQQLQYQALAGGSYTAACMPGCVPAARGGQTLQQAFKTPVQGACIDQAAADTSPAALAGAHNAGTCLVAYPNQREHSTSSSSSTFQLSPLALPASLTHLEAAAAGTRRLGGILAGPGQQCAGMAPVSSAAATAPGAGGDHPGDYVSPSSYFKAEPGAAAAAAADTVNMLLGGTTPRPTHNATASTAAQREEHGAAPVSEDTAAVTTTAGPAGTATAAAVMSSPAPPRGLDLGSEGGHEGFGSLVPRWSSGGFAGPLLAGWQACLAPSSGGGAGGLFDALDSPCVGSKPAQAAAEQGAQAGAAGAGAAELPGSAVSGPTAGCEVASGAAPAAEGHQQLQGCKKQKREVSMGRHVGLGPAREPNAGAAHGSAVGRAGAATAPTHPPQQQQQDKQGAPEQVQQQRQQEAGALGVYIAQLSQAASAAVSPQAPGAEGVTAGQEAASSMPARAGGAHSAHTHATGVGGGSRQAAAGVAGGGVALTPAGAGPAVAARDMWADLEVGILGHSTSSHVADLLQWAAEGADITDCW